MIDIVSNDRLNEVQNKQAASSEDITKIGLERTKLKPILRKNMKTHANKKGSLYFDLIRSTRSYGDEYSPCPTLSATKQPFNGSNLIR